MAGSSLLALLDDITTLLDDVAVLTKTAATKTTGVMGDDLALNAEQVTGLKASRELPVVWAVAKGSFLNKLILVPLALVISAFVPAAIAPLLMLGGLFLCFEGVEKVAHKFLPHDAEEETHRRSERVQALAKPDVDLVALEKDRIKGAIRTDFILSAEIVVIALGTMSAAPMSRQIVALTVIAMGVTVLVYGLVAGIVKLDDLGLRLNTQDGQGSWDRTQRAIGSGILTTAPYLMKSLSVLGTAAMFIVGGSIIAHGIPPVAHQIELWAEHAAERASLLGLVVSTLLEALVGLVSGGVAVGVVTAGKKLFGGKEPAPASGDGGH